MRTQIMQSFAEVWLPVPRKVQLSVHLDEVDLTHNTPRKIASLVQRVRELVNSTPILRGNDLLLAFITIQEVAYLADFRNCPEETIFYLTEAQRILAEPFTDSLDAIWQNRIAQ